MPPDPNAPTPGTENEPPWIGYDAIEKLAKNVREFAPSPWEREREHLNSIEVRDAGGDEVAELISGANIEIGDDGPQDRLSAFIAALDPATILALVRKARQRDEAERGIGDCIKEISVSALTGEIPDRAFTKGRLDGLGFALDALRREP